MPSLDVQALKRNDKSAWDEAFRCLWPVAFRAAYFPGMSLEDRQDLAQTSLVQLAARIQKLRDERHLVHSLIDIVRKRSLDEQRKRLAEKRDARLTVSLPDDDGHPQAGAPGGEAEQSLDWIWEVLDTLCEECRSILYLRFRAGQPWEQVAADLGTSLANVKRKASGCLESLRIKAKRFLDELP